jgi:AcrR family transcriptional regulator
MIADDALLDKILDAGRKLIVEKGFGAFTMTALAQEAGVALADLYRHVPDRVALLQAFTQRVDLAMLAQVPDFGPEETRRDRLFDVLMMRLELSAPNRAAQRAAQKDLRHAPGDGLRLTSVLLNSMRWVAEVAGIPVDGFAGAARLRALLTIYISVLYVWMEDEDPGLAKTMAALDRRLRQLENLWPAIWGEERASTKQPNGHEAHA